MIDILKGSEKYIFYIMHNIISSVTFKKMFLLSKEILGKERKNKFDNIAFSVGISPQVIV